MNTSVNASEIPKPAPEQLLQMQMQAAMFNPYGAPFFPYPGFPAQQLPDFFQMYMPGMAPGVPAVPVIPEQSKQQTPSPTRSTDSGNETISPLQQQQQTPSNLSTTPHVPSIPNPFPQTPHVNPMIIQQGTASPYAMNNILGASKSANTSPTNPGAAEEQENGSKRRNTFPTSSAKRPLLSEQASMRFDSAMHPNMMMMRMYMDQRRDHCVICGDNATGYHYKAMSCEGCKGFFRRSVPPEVHEKYVCMQGEMCQFTLENCAVNRNFRNRCKYCRFQRCLAMGMSKECVRPIDHRTKKDAHGSMENLSPTVEALVNVFQSLMSTRERIASKAHAVDCIRSLLLNASVFSNIEATEQLIEQLLPGLMTLRAAFTLDTLPFFTADNANVAELIEKMRSGIRNTILFDEGLAILSGIFIFQFTNGGSGETFESFYNGLRQHFDTTQSQESGTTERLLTKLGLLL